MLRLSPTARIAVLSSGSEEGISFGKEISLTSVQDHVLESRGGLVAGSRRSATMRFSKVKHVNNPGDYKCVVSSLIRLTLLILQSPSILAFNYRRAESKVVRRIGSILFVAGTLFLHTRYD
jgi:hypothetical protein